METFWNWLGGLGVIGWVMVMIIAVTACQSAVTMFRMHIKHKERMAMIERGMDPDLPERTNGNKAGRL